MADENKDVIRVWVNEANLATTLKSGMFGAAEDTFRFSAKRESDGAIRYWSDDTKQVLLAGAQTITDVKTHNANLEISGLNKLRVGTTRKLELASDEDSIVSVKAPSSADLMLNASDASKNIRLRIGTVDSITVEADRAYMGTAKQFQLAASTSARGSLLLPAGAAPSGAGLTTDSIWKVNDAIFVRNSTDATRGIEVKRQLISLTPTDQQNMTPRANGYFEISTGNTDPSTIVVGLASGLNDGDMLILAGSQSGNNSFSIANNVSGSAGIDFQPFDTGSNRRIELDSGEFAQFMWTGSEWRLWYHQGGTFAAD